MKKNVVAIAISVIAIVAILLIGVSGCGPITTPTPEATPTKEAKSTPTEKAEAKPSPAEEESPTVVAAAKATDTATPKPSPTPEPTDTATPRPSPTPEPTDTATPKPSPTPEPTDTATPKPSPTPEPTDTPTKKPSPTPRPTNTSTPSPTPEPTDTPTNTPTPSPTPLPPVPPTMVGRSPARGEEHPLAEPLVITFDQPMDWESVKKAFSIEPKVAGELSGQDRELTFTPAKPFERGQTYEVTIAESARSAAGLPLEEAISLKFSTIGFLEVTDVQPAPETVEVGMDAVVTVMLNRPVVPLTSIQQMAELPQPLTFLPAVEGEGEWLNTSVYIYRPTKGFAPATKYKARVAAGLTDTTGGLLAEDYTWSFTTKLPAVSDTWPGNKTQYVGPDAKVSVTFNQPMDHESVEEHFSLIDESGKTVRGEFDWEDDLTVTFTPLRSLKLETIYMGQVSAGAMGQVGNRGTRKTYDWSFTTVSLPIIVSTDPYDGQEDANPYGGMDITFSSPISRETLLPNLTILPEPTYVYSYWSRYDTKAYLSFDTQPSTRYTVTIESGVRGRYGHRLDRDYTIHYTTRDLGPYVYLSTGGYIGTYNAYTETVAYVSCRNVSRLRFRLYRLARKDLISFVSSDWWDAWEVFEPGSENLVRAWSKEVSPPPNKSEIWRIPLSESEDGRLEPGLYYLKVWAPEDPEGARQVLVVSRLNLTLKQSGGEALVWATDLRNGQVVPSVPVVFYDERGKQVASGKTDKDGVLKVEFERLEPYEAFFAIAAEGQRGRNSLFGMSLNQWNDGINSWDFNINSELYSRDYSGYLYTDRPIYRPGQKVYFKGIIRADDYARYSLPEGEDKVLISISNPQGEEIYSEELSLNDMGTMHSELALDEEADLGYYYIYATYKNEGFGQSFQVAEYRKPEFEVTVQTDRDEYAQGETVNVTVQGTYYFGGPVTKAKVHWTLMSRDYFFYWKGKGWYDFTDYDWTRYWRYSEYGEFVSEGEGQTDKDGRFTFKVPADIADKITSQVFTIEAAVTDINDQLVANRTEAIVHKGLFYIGLRPQSYVGQINKEQNVNVIVVDWESEPVPDVDVEVIFYEHKWYSVKKEAEDGSFYWESDYLDTPVFTRTVTTDRKGEAIAAFTPTKGGTYKIAASGQDEIENEVRSSTYTWISGREFINWRQENNNRIDLVTDKKSYTPGETAKILIPSPYQGEVKALLTVERGRVLEHRILTLKTNSEQVEIPIQSDYTPNVYVSVVLVKGLDETSPVASFKVGYATLVVSTVEKELQVKITPDKDMEKGEYYHPRDTVTYDIEALNYKGEGVEAELSLTLVDKAVLALASEAGPDLLSHFWQERGVGIQTSASLVVSIDRRNLEVAPEAKGGGGGEAPGATVRSRFPDAVYWNPALRTDQDGKAQVKVELPDNLTTWRLGARAITADTEVGQVTVDVRATKDLLVQPIAPRFFIIGDKAILGAVIHNNTSKSLETTISLSVEGLTIEDEAERTVQVPAEDKVKVTWQTSVEHAETAKLLYWARSDALEDAIEISLPIHRYSTPEVVATAGQLKEEGSRVEIVQLPKRLDPTQGELTIEVDPSLAAGMRDGLKYLETFPYYCIEQTVSRFLPNVMTYRALKKLGLSKPELETKLPQYVSVGLQRIYALQHYDGGWGWWLYDDSNSWLTAYVLFGLVEAKRADFAVEEEVMERAADYLWESLGRSADVMQPHYPNTQAFILYVLAEYGEGDLGRTVALYERERERLGNYGKALLAMALDILDPDDRSRVNSLVSDLTSAAIVSATGAHWEEGRIDYWTMNTNTRSTAIVLDALTRLKPDSGLVTNAVRWLMVARKEGHWETTQETAWSLIALTDYMEMTGELEADYSYQVLLNGEMEGEGVANADNLDEPYKLQIAIADLLAEEANRVQIDRFSEKEQTGLGRLYYSMYLRYFLPVQDIKALDRGIIVSRQYSFPDEPDEWIDEAQVGDVIQVRLTIVAPHDLHYLVVEDPLPAGCEALDRSLKTTTQIGTRPEMKIKEAEDWHRWGWGWWWFSHTEVRDEKVALFATYLPRGTYEYTYLMRASLAGEFQAIPTLAYEFYFPEVFGRSDGGKFTVNEAEE